MRKVIFFYDEEWRKNGEWRIPSKIGGQISSLNCKERNGERNEKYKFHSVLSSLHFIQVDTTLGMDKRKSYKKEKIYTKSWGFR